MIYPKNFEEKTGFDKIRQVLIEKCLSSLGRKQVNEMVFSTIFQNIQTALNEVNEFKTICLLEDNFPSSNFFDATPYLSKARIDGTFLDVQELFDLKRSLETIKAIILFFNAKSKEKYPYLFKQTENINVPKYILERLDQIISKFGTIKDNASKELIDIRVDLNKKQGSVSRKLSIILKQVQNEGWVSSDLSLTIVNGRTVIPIDSTHKRKIKGLVHDESATGKTSYIEPAEIVELNNEIKELEYAERREIVKILVAFTAELKPYIDDILHSYDFLGTIDFIRAKALYAISIDAILPSVADVQGTSLFGAKHPILMSTLRKEKKEVVPLNIRLDEKNRIVLISGPNAGGKSVCLKTTGILQYMVQCGLLVPVGGSSEFGIFENIFIDIGDEQSIENDLSTYSSHLINMKFFLKNCNKKSLLLIDEFGSGTEPMLGGAIAEAVLEKLNTTGTFGVITTHYTNLKHYAASAEGIVNGAMLYDNNKMEPLFMLAVGKPGSSFAFEIARKIGLPEDLLESASNKVGKENILFDKHLRDVLRDKRYWETKRIKIRQDEKKLEELIEENLKDLNSIEKERKTIISKAKQEAENILSGTNKQIENTIRTIKEINAEKEKTKEIRKELDTFKSTVLNTSSDESEKILRKIEKLKDREKALLENKDQKEEKPKEKVIPEPENTELKTGDKVRIINKDIVGEVTDIGKHNAVIAFGNMLTSMPKDQIEKITNNEYKKLQKEKPAPISNISANYQQKLLEFKSSIDLRGKRADEALQITAEFIDNAIMLNRSEVKILHGKGNGILRSLIREYLKTIDLIKSIKDESIQFGGDGITIVRFE